MIIYNSYEAVSHRGTIHKLYGEGDVFYDQGHYPPYAFWHDVSATSASAGGVPG